MTDTPETIMKQYFETYKKLGSIVNNLRTFIGLHDEFIKHTINSFVWGDVCNENECPFIDEKGNWVYQSNRHSLEGFCQATKTSYEEASKIFDAIDTVYS